MKYSCILIRFINLIVSTANKKNQQWNFINQLLVNIIFFFQQCGKRIDLQFTSTTIKLLELSIVEEFSINYNFT